MNYKISPGRIHRSTLNASCLATLSAVAVVGTASTASLGSDTTLCNSSIRGVRCEVGIRAPTILILALLSLISFASLAILYTVMTLSGATSETPSVSNTTICGIMELWEVVKGSVFLV